MTIFLDLDGVLANFNFQLDKFMSLKNLNLFKEKEESWAQWESRTNISIFSIFYKSLNAEEALNFWSTIPEYRWVYKIIDLLSKHEVIILTAIPDKRLGFALEASIGKEYWCKKRFPELQIKIVSRDEKKNFANSNSLLIDDYNKNIEEFIQAGGKAILFKNFEQLKKEFNEITK